MRFLLCVHPIPQVLPKFQFPLQNGSDIMAILMTSSEAQIAGKEAEIAEVERARQSAEFLSARGDGQFTIYTCFL